MSWSPDFIERIGADVVAPLYLLESVPVAELRSFGGELALSSFPASGYTAALVPVGSSVSWGRLSPMTWRRSHSTLQIAIRGDVDVRPYTTRGQCVRLRIGFAGWSTDAFATVFLGQVRNLSWSASGGVWVLQIVDIVGALTSRFTTTPTESGLFHALGSTTLSATYTHGSSTTISLTSNTGFAESSADSGEGYLLEITPTGGGTPFYVHAGARTGTTYNTLTVGMFGTTGVTATAGSAVRAGYYTTAHPLQVARRVLTSTGTAGANGNADVLPASWAYGIGVEHIDEDDLAAFRDIAAPFSGSADWDFWGFEGEQNGLAKLETWLAGGGFFLSQHQGALTGRAIVAPYEDDTPSGLDVTDDDIADLVGYQAFSDDVPVEYRRVAHQDGSGTLWTTTEATITTRPAADRYVYDASGDYSMTLEWSLDLSARMRPYLTRPPEGLTLVCRGWRCGQMSPGDVARLYTAHLGSRFRDSQADFSAGRRLLVIGGGPDWFGGSTRLELLSVSTGD